MKCNSKSSIIGLTIFGVASCSILWKLYRSTPCPDKPKEDDLSTRLISLERELECTKKKLAAIEKLLAEKNTEDMAALALGAKHFAPIANSIKLSKIINEITVVNHPSSDTIEKSMSHLAQKIVKALNVVSTELRQEFQHEIRSKLGKAMDLHHKQKLLIFEILVGYVLDTNLQQSHDFAVLKTLIEKSDEGEQERIYNDLKAKALEAVEKILSDAAVPLEPAMPLDSGYASASLSARELDIDDHPQLLMGMVRDD